MSVCVEMPQARTPEETLLTGKTHPCDICVPFLTDILHLDDLPGQNLFFVEACSILQGQKNHSAKNPLKGDVDSDSLMKNCMLHVSGNPFIYWKIRKDFSAKWDSLQSLNSSKDEKLSEITKSVEANRKSHFKSQ